MLKTPTCMLGATARDPILAMISGIRGDCSETPLQEGFLKIRHFSGDMMLWGGNNPPGHDYETNDLSYMTRPWLVDVAEIDCSGVCDSPEQFIRRYADKLEADPRTFVVTFTHIEKDPSNRGQGGGWRWHKWGEYIGEGVPEYEYLDDETGFENGVYCYHVYQVDGPEVKDPMMARMEARLAAEKANAG